MTISSGLRVGSINPLAVVMDFAGFYLSKSVNGELSRTICPNESHRLPFMTLRDLLFELRQLHNVFHFRIGSCPDGPFNKYAPICPPCHRVGASKKASATPRPSLNFVDPAQGMKARRAKTIERCIQFKSGDGPGSRQPDRSHARRRHHFMTDPRERTVVSATTRMIKMP